MLIVDLVISVTAEYVELSSHAAYGHDVSLLDVSYTPTQVTYHGLLCFDLHYYYCNFLHARTYTKQVVVAKGSKNGVTYAVCTGTQTSFVFSFFLGLFVHREFTLETLDSILLDFVF